MKIDTREFIKLWLMKNGSTDLNENQAKRYLQLVGLLEDHIFWEKANDYRRIVDSFCNNEITAKEFEAKFWAIRNSAAHNFDRLLELLEQDILSNELKLPKMEINPKSKDFTTAIDEQIVYLLISDLLTVQEIQQTLNDHIRPKLAKYCDK